MNEFELIARYFTRPTSRARLGVGDDCALLDIAAGHTLATSTDMLVAGRHFFHDVDPAALGWKTLAVNLSDLAAIGAKPLAFTLALALPALDESWLKAFSEGLFACADAHDCELVGGDTTRGPLTLCVTVFGEVVAERALQRDAARVGDDVWVSGTLGGAAFALRALGRSQGDANDALHRPVPRVALGRALLGVAHAAIDVSDGLAQDLGHVLTASAVGATVRVDALPIHRALAGLQRDEQMRLALTGGDDYELCFTAAPDARGAIERAADATRTPVTRVGHVDFRPGFRLVMADGAPWQSADTSLAGFDHFA